MGPPTSSSVIVKKLLIHVVFCSLKIFDPRWHEPSTHRVNRLEDSGLPFALSKD